MGWWSCTIMGGDSPLDWLGSLMDVCGIEFDYGCGDETYHGYLLDRDKIEAKTNAMLKCATKGYESSIGLQVLGAVLMEVGAPIDAKLKRTIIRAAKDDEWMLEEGRGSERGKYVMEFIEKIKAHKTGESTELAYEGLFENLAKKMGG